MCIAQVDPWCDAQNHVVAGEPRERRRRRIVRRRRVRGAVAGDDHRSIGRGEQGLPVADVAGQLVGVADPRTMALVELHPIDGEALRDDLVAVHDEQAPAMMCGVVAAALGRDPEPAAHRRAQLQRFLGPHRDATDQA